MVACCGNKKGTCFCKVTAGEGILVTGRGNVNKPYVISAVGGGGGDNVAFFLPEDYGAEGDGVTNDRAALQATFDAAYNAGGGIVYLSKKYGWLGDLFHRGGITVLGTGIPRYPIPEIIEGGLIALGPTARYRYGRWNAAGSVDDNPGPLMNLIINGNNIGGTTELVRMECVDGAITDCHIIRSAGTCVEVHGSQNATLDRCLLGYAAGTALNFMTTGSQGAGNVKINNTYFATSDRLVHADADPTQFWPHDIFFDKCLFENYTAGNDLIHLKAGEFQFLQCVFTNSNSGAPQPPNNCLIFIEQTARPLVPTQVVFDGCYFNSALTPHMVRVKSVSGVSVGNFVRFYGKTYAQGANALIGVDGGSTFSSHVTIKGDLFLSGVPEVYETLGDGLLWNCVTHDTTPQRWEKPADVGSLLAPLGVRNEGASADLWHVSWAGKHLWFDGVDGATVRASSGYDIAASEGQIGGSWRVMNEWRLGGTVVFVNTVGQDVPLVSGSTSAPQSLLVFQFPNSTADITISGGVDGSQAQVVLFAPGITDTSVTWPANIHFNGSPPQVPAAGGVIVVNLVKIATDWYATDDKPADVDQIDANRIQVGQEAMPRDWVTNDAVATISGLLELTYFTAYRSETITSLRTYTGAIAAGATPTLCRMGLYSVAANGDLTLLSATVNDTALWAATFTGYTRALAAPQAVVKGGRYAVGLLCVTPAAAPAWPNQSVSAMLSSLTPRLAGIQIGVSDLPASILAGAVSNGTTRRYSELLP